jgi:ribosome-associated protein
VTDRLTIGLDELDWRFSRSSGPGGQGVNTADSRVELLWSPAGSLGLAGLPEHLRARVTDRLAAQLVNGSIVVVVSANRAQLRNREQARRRLAEILRSALAPSPAVRRPSKPTRGSIERRLAGKKARSAVKSSRSSRTHRADD